VASSVVSLHGCSAHPTPTHPPDPTISTLRTMYLPMYEFDQHPTPEAPGARPADPPLDLRPPTGPRDRGPTEQAARRTDAPRRAPEVTGEWPADNPPARPAPLDWPLVLMAGLLALLLLGLAPGRFLTTPAGLAILASLTALSALALRMSLKMEDPADRALQRAQRAIWYEEDSRVVTLRLREACLRGRAGPP